MNSYLEAKSGESHPRGSTALAVASRSANLPASTGISDPYLAFSAAESGQDILGDMIRFAKGDYLAGANKTEIPGGSEFLAAVDAIVVGWQRWLGKQQVEKRLGRLSDGFIEPAREELGHLDESAWEVDAEGRPVDPWAKTRMVPLKRLADGTLFTLVLNGKGRSGEAIGRLVGAFGRSRYRDTDYPIIRLGTDAYSHKVYGRIKFPVLPIVGWRPRHEFAELETSGDIASGSPGSTGGRDYDGGIPERIDSEIPF
jgi:hypothetical protein